MKRLLFALWALNLAACARQVVPEGGPKDTTPPAVVPEKSTPNMATRFTGREVRLTFNEWVVLQDAATQVLVSPPLAKRPEITLKGKTVIVKFKEDEVLRPNTTYTVNFGTAVKDLHESNPAKDLRFVFSTGDFIDSLTVGGLVVGAFTGEPAENISVMLYDSPEDSIIRKERPYYLARTDKSGAFSIPNVRAGSFKCVAIDDVNQNLKWDGDSERIGFPAQAVPVSDSNRSILRLRIFKPTPSLRQVSQNANRYGLVKLGYTAPPDSVRLQADLPGLKWLTERDKDTILVWYDRPDSVAWKLIAGKDTVSVKALSRSSFLAGNQVRFADDAAPAGSGAQKRARQTGVPPAKTIVKPPPKTQSINPNKPPLLAFNHPIAAFDTSKWLLIIDSVSIRTFIVRPDTLSARTLQFQAAWQEGKAHALKLLPGAVTDMYGTANADTLERILVAPDPKKLGALNLTLTSLQPGRQYVLQLLNGAALEEERIFTATAAEQRFVFSKLQP
ncbi:MAG: Ig-like domain-containing protein, partial [Thermoanaerobaculia bacterium]|nr:Ig-like domain-containing protein [Thermoanaerobaculia bacterium]